MPPSFNKTDFIIKFLKLSLVETLPLISFRFEYKACGESRVLLHKLKLIDHINNEISIDENVLFSNGQKNHNVKILSKESIQKLLLKGLTMEIHFFSDSGIFTKIEYSVDKFEKALLKDITTVPMSVNDKKVFESVLLEQKHSTTATSSGIDDSSLSGNASGSNGDSGHSSSPSDPYDAPVTLGIKSYIDALKQEKYYLMQEGGRKYKVSNGELISHEQDKYYYVFEMESELYIADDAPISVIYEMFKAKGTVMICEDFMIIIELKENLGQYIRTALITVEPWKLLDYMAYRIANLDKTGNQKMLEMLIDQGPALSTTKDIDLIPKGQNEVIKKATKEPICIVWGPPGTGKTHTMAELAIHFVKQNKRIIIVSHSNVSVDGVAKKIYEMLLDKQQTSLLEQGKVLRYGYVRDEELHRNPYVDSFTYTQKQNPEFDARLTKLQEEQKKLKAEKGPASELVIKKGKAINELRAELKKQEQQNVKNARIVATTISKLTADRLFQNMMYDVVMFDEVSMAYVPQVAAASTWCKEHLICVGDFMQLSPIAQSSAKEVLCNDIFSHLKINRYGTPYYHPWLVMLNEQRRMHPSISAFASKYIYHGLLKDHGSTKTSRNKIVRKKLFPEDAIILINLIGTCCVAGKNADNSRYNILSGLLSFACAVNTEKHIDSVSIITPYAAQTRLIRALVLDYRNNKKQTSIRCATVHQFQGSESDVIIFDAVESYPSKKPGWLMGKDLNEIMRLINVAVTRARGKLITVANVSFWTNIYTGSNHTLYRLLAYLLKEGKVIKHQDDSIKQLVSELSLPGGPQFYVEREAYLEQLAKDFTTAQEKILISMPSGKLDTKTEVILLAGLNKAFNRGVSIEIKCREYSKLPATWKKYAIGSDDALFPLLLIDNKITWYGVPEADWEYKDKNTYYKTVRSIACRVKGNHTNEMIRSLTDIDKQKYSTSTGEDQAKKLNGFPLYIKEHKKCPNCKGPMMFARGKKSGKAIQWCKECKKSHFITPDDVEHYMLVEHVYCPTHKTQLTAKLGSYGMYVRCECGHNLKLEDI